MARCSAARSSILRTAPTSVKPEARGAMTLAPPEEIRLEEHKRRYDALFVNRFEVDVAGTRCTLWAEVRMTGWRWLLSPLARPLARPQMRRFVLEPVKRAAEHLEGCGDRHGSAMKLQKTRNVVARAAVVDP
jgi:hypothetical protein